jgi:hypothetical protein
VADLNPGGGAGYLHERYAESLSEFGLPRRLPESAAWIIERPISLTAYSDAMGPYPLFLCGDWSKLGADLQAMTGLVSLALVADPFGDHTPELLRSTFPDVMIPFKEHFVVDLASREPGSPSHRYHARRAAKDVSVEAAVDPASWLDEWVRLYEVLAARRRITGIARFSRESFAKQLAVPGIAAFRAVYRAETVGMTLWYRIGNLAYWHLSAFDDAGYRLRASYALAWSAMQYFRDNGVRWLDLGAGAGTRAGEGEGLETYKKGWATGTRTAYFCGRVLDKPRYSALTGAAGGKGVPSYFPAYRAGEFG